MKELIISEFLRMRKRKKNKICILMLIVSFIFTLVWDKTPFLGSGTEFYTPDISTKINSLNFAIFSMKNLILLLFLIVLPVLFIDSLSGEYESGAYRLILTRPYTRTQLWISKLIVQSLFAGAIFTVFFIASTIFGYLLFPKVSTTTFYTNPRLYNAVDALIYNFKAVALMYLISNAILALSSVISSIIPKVVPSFILLLCTLAGGMYANDSLEVFIFPFNKIVRLLSLGERTKFYTPVLACLIVGFILSTFIFNKKDLRA
ncbi:ABC transporter permease [Clostridium tetanomorphum]|uniref:ABC transporter permease subunit n=1 Tax=Clostridium tetanomorphum TaxID=1553 RepID=A0A923EAJ9_CLOTT|nr:ABC transporter permease [Clostridium tetanomorphum]MBC2396828.1 ABC transporter permease subunit [Clostridium tetanomorphum]NRZ97532.1 ABC-type transport system involved in multi-copper enzyme maturation permease subunit [Clostridium tetanomorphum]